MKVLFLINDSTYTYNLRGAIIDRLIAEGHEVTVACKLLEHQDKLEAMGAKLINIEIGRHGKNPFADVILLNTYKKIIRDIAPSVVLTYNIKPNAYGGMACSILKVPYIANVTGLGTPIENPGPLQKLTMKLYQFGIANATCVFFQNETNKQFFLDHKMIKPTAHMRVLPGSGVDLRTHPYLSYPKGKIRFLFAARIMKEKGIDLFLSAARKYASEDVIFDICGGCDDKKYLSLLQTEACVHYHGEVKNMVPYYQNCSCFLYPSYYPEGMSNVLLEAAACGRPVVAADRAGCRETVEDNITGYLVKVNDEHSVHDAVERFLSLTWQDRKLMGAAGREKIEREFDRKIVVDAYCEEMRRINGL